MLFKEAVSKRIYDLCDINNISPNKLAELSTVPPTTLEDMLLLKVNNPSSFVIYQLCKTLKITIKEFFDSELFLEKNLED